MGLLNFEVVHTLSKDDAKRRVEHLLAYWKTKYGVTSQWNGDRAQISGKVMKVDLTGSLSVSDQSVSGEATDPGFLLREPARSYLNKKLKIYLDPESDPVRLATASD